MGVHGSPWFNHLSTLFYILRLWANIYVAYNSFLMEYTKWAQNSLVRFEMGKVKFDVLMAKCKRNKTSSSRVWESRPP